MIVDARPCQTRYGFFGHWDDLGQWARSWEWNGSAIIQSSTFRRQLVIFVYSSLRVGKLSKWVQPLLLNGPNWYSPDQSPPAPWTNRKMSTTFWDGHVGNRVLPIIRKSPSCGDSRIFLTCSGQTECKSVAGITKERRPTGSSETVLEDRCIILRSRGCVGIHADNNLLSHPEILKEDFPSGLPPLLSLMDCDAALRCMCDKASLDGTGWSNLSWKDTSETWLLLAASFEISLT